MKEEVYPIDQTSESKEIIRLSLAGTTFPDKNYHIRRTHSYTACIEFVEQGSGTVELDGEVFFPKAGDTYFLQTGRDHFYYANREEPWKKHFINVSGRLLESMTEGYGLSGISHFEGLDTKEELLKIIALAKTKEDPTEAIIGVLHTVFMKMRRHLKEHENTPKDARRMKDFLNARLTEKFHIEHLCAYIGKSESQTIRLFKSSYGITPYRYVLDKKIGLAKKLLLDTALTVGQIAEKLAFSDEYYFSNIFKTKVGTSPSSFRRGKQAAKKKD